MSSGCGACSMSKAYWKPEQPPPLTLMRSIDPDGSPPMISLMRRAARSVRLISLMWLSSLPFLLRQR
jgi:hypothetical protein